MFVWLVYFKWTLLVFYSWCRYVESSCFIYIFTRILLKISTTNVQLLTSFLSLLGFTLENKLASALESNSPTDIPSWCMRASDECDLTERWGSASCQTVLLLIVWAADEWSHPPFWHVFTSMDHHSWHNLPQNQRKVLSGADWRQHGDTFTILNMKNLNIQTQQCSVRADWPHNRCYGSVRVMQMQKNLKHSKLKVFIWSSSTYGSKCQSDVFKRTSDVGQVPRAVAWCIHRCVKSSLPGAMSVTPATATSLSALSWTFISFSRAITISSCSIPTNTPHITRDGVTHHSF